MKAVIVSIFFTALIIISCGQQDKASAAVNSSAATTANLKGKELFMQNCASCHTIDKEMVGPPLAGVEKRWSSKKRLYEFIRNAPEVIKKDKYAYDLYMKYNQTMMNPFPDLTDRDIDAIMEYVRTRK